MNSFGFEIILFLNDFNNLTLTPPSSFALLRDIALEKFDITKAEFTYLALDGGMYNITNESEYFNMFNFVSDEELKEIYVYVNAADMLKKKKASRKNSRAKRPNLTTGYQGESAFSDSEFGHYDAEDQKDMRNLKYNEELNDGVKYTKHGYNKKNLARIEFIKERKELEKIEAEEKQKVKQELIQKELEENMDDINFGKKNKNRKGNKVLK